MTTDAYMSKEELILFLGYLREKEVPVVPHRLCLSGRPFEPALSDPGEDAQTLLDAIRGCADPNGAYAAAARLLGRVCSAPRVARDADGVCWQFREDVTDALYAHGLPFEESNAYAALIASGEYGRICRSVERGGMSPAKPSRNWRDLSSVSEPIHRYALTVGHLPARQEVTDKFAYEYRLFCGKQPNVGMPFPVRTTPFSEAEKRYAMENRPRLTPIRVNATAEEINGTLTLKLSFWLRDSRHVPRSHRTISLGEGVVLDGDHIQGIADSCTMQVEVGVDGVFSIDLPPVTVLPEPGTDAEAAARFLNSLSAVLHLSGLTVSNGLITADVSMSVQVNTDLTGRGNSNFYYDEGCTLTCRELLLCTDKIS